MRVLEDLECGLSSCLDDRAGQSIYEIARYTDVNNMGTAVLMEALIENPVEQFGDGLYFYFYTIC